jgi:hypothetical protein
MSETARRSTEELMTEIKKTFALLQTVRDETKVKVHLAKMDVKEAWDALQPKLAEAERVGQSAAESATEAALEALKATAKSLQTFAASL